MHHFNPISALLPVLREKLTDSGKIISVDPLQTSILTRAVRGLYDRFRVNREWEWPFTDITISEIEKYFNISKIQGFVGKSKYAIPTVLVSKSLGTRIATRLHKYDIKEANIKGKALWSCLQVAACLEKKTGPSD